MLYDVYLDNMGVLMHSGEVLSDENAYIIMKDYDDRLDMCMDDLNRANEEIQDLKDQVELYRKMIDTIENVMEMGEMR